MRKGEPRGLWRLRGAVSGSRPPRPSQGAIDAWLAARIGRAADQARGRRPAKATAAEWDKPWRGADTSPRIGDDGNARRREGAALVAKLERKAARKVPSGADQGGSSGGSRERALSILAFGEAPNPRSGSGQPRSTRLVPGQVTDGARRQSRQNGIGAMGQGMASLGRCRRQRTLFVTEDAGGEANPMRGGRALPGTGRPGWALKGRAVGRDMVVGEERAEPMWRVPEHLPADLLEPHERQARLGSSRPRLGGISEGDSGPCLSPRRSRDSLSEA